MNIMTKLEEVEKAMTKIIGKQNSRRKTFYLRHVMIAFRRLRTDYVVTPMGDFIEILEGGEWHFAKLENIPQWGCVWEHELPLQRQPAEVVDFLHRTFCQIKCNKQ